MNGKTIVYYCQIEKKIIVKCEKYNTKRLREPEKRVKHYEIH